MGRRSRSEDGDPLEEARRTEPQPLQGEHSLEKLIPVSPQIPVSRKFLTTAREQPESVC